MGEIQVISKEVRVNLEILSVCDYNTLPSKALHWSSGDDKSNKAVFDCIRRNRFDVIMKYLHNKITTVLSQDGNVMDQLLLLRKYGP